tara:strand:- start:794 stop:1057 length:264 start_codon:yes stop_codon:yes gene_type:complete
MTSVEIYTWKFCPFCIRAKALLSKKGINYIEYAIDGDEEARSQMRDRSDGRNTVPQIFINDKSIGGCDELYELDQNQVLDALLKEEE